MKNPVQLINTTDPVRNSLNRPLWRRGFLLIQLIIALVCFALLPQAHADCQQGCVGLQNTALGNAVLISNTSGISNTGIGFRSLSSNTSGVDNTGVGYITLTRVTTGGRNTAVGASALRANTGWYNSALGTFALEENTSGYYNSAVGDSALSSNTTGGSNTAIGLEALLYNTTGSNNIAVGNAALQNNTIGLSNVAIGYHAGINLTTGSNNVDIGNSTSGVAGESNTIRIGTEGTQTAAFIAGIRGTPVIGGIPVGVTTSGQLGVAPSSQRFKEAVKPMDKASEAILALQPVTFRYKHELDPDGIPQFGLVAEQVEKVNPDLVARDEQGKPYTVRYDAVNAMLLNEFLKEHRKVEEQTVINQRQEATIARQQKDFVAAIAQQQKEIAALTAALKAQAAQIQKVSDQLKTQAASPRVVAND